MKNNFSYIYLKIFFQKMLDEGRISEKEFREICRYNAEMLKPDPQYIW